jgi:hypothetical protein
MLQLHKCRRPKDRRTYYKEVDFMGIRLTGERAAEYCLQINLQDLSTCPSRGINRKSEHCNDKRH